MNKIVQEKITDITGIELTPRHPTVCLGNGEQGFECCCDECDYFLLCFPEFDVEIKEENIAESKNNTTKQQKNDREYRAILLRTVFRNTVYLERGMPYFVFVFTNAVLIRKIDKP